MAHNNIAFQERFPLSLLPCISLLFSFFAVTVPVMEVDHQKFQFYFIRVKSITRAGCDGQRGRSNSPAFPGKTAHIKTLKCTGQCPAKKLYPISENGKRALETSDCLNPSRFLFLFPKPASNFFLAWDFSRDLHFSVNDHRRRRAEDSLPGDFRQVRRILHHGIRTHTLDKLASINTFPILIFVNLFCPFFEMHRKYLVIVIILDQSSCRECFRTG